MFFFVLDGPGTNVVPEGFKLGLPVGKNVRNEVGSGLLGAMEGAARIGVLMGSCLKVIGGGV